MKAHNARNTLRWFDPRNRQVGSWAFVLNRLTALGLIVYLVLHLVVLNRLTQGEQAYDDFVAFAQTAWIKASEVLLITAVVLHGLNGLRLVFLAFGMGVRQQKLIFGAVVTVTILVSSLFALHLFVK